MEDLVLETERLIMRPHQISDFGDSAAMWADAGVTRYIGGKPFTAEDAWLRLMRYVGHWSLLGFGYWAAREKTTGDFVGEIGFADLKRDLTPRLELPEIGWVLAPGMQGKGYATEAALAAIAWGEGHFPDKSSVCLIHPDNAGSLRVAAKCGYRERHLSTYKGAPTIILFRD